MKYVSDDGKVFDTAQECYKYEQKIEEDKEKREQMEMERLNRIDAINKKYEELQKLISQYGEDYGVRREIYFTPFYDFISMLCG